jgi:transposase
VLSRWVAERGAVRAGGSAEAPTSQAALPSADQADVIARLQRENEQLRMERDILKKSIAIFAGPRT